MRAAHPLAAIRIIIVVVIAKVRRFYAKIHGERNNLVHVSVYIGDRRRTNMLEDSVFESAGRREPRSPLTTIYSVLAHGAVLGILILAPLLQMHAIPIPRLETLLPLPHFVHQEVIE